MPLSTLPVSPWTYPFMGRHYPGFPHLWTQETLGLLFIVKVPSDLEHLSESTYLDLMQTRLDGLIQDWVAETTQAETQQLLASTLSSLDSAQEVPLLEPDENPDFALEQWRQQWAETLILHNWRFQERLRHYGVRFPVRPVSTDYPDYRDWISLHDETTLETWLAELTL
jgi:hypothetical protein